MVRYTSKYVSDATGYLITANVTYEEVQINSEIVAETPTPPQPETIQEQTMNLAETNTGITIAGMPWQDLLLLFFATGSVALGFVMIGLLAKFRPKPRAWLAIPKKESKEKGE